MRADLRSAVDRPARCDIELAAPQRAPPEVPAAWRVGRQVDVAIGRERAFSGVVTAAGVVWDGAGSRVRATAHDAFDVRRARMVGARFFQSTDADIARDIAFELGLDASIEPTREVFERVSVDEDPLRFLRRRAREIGFQLGVVERRLIFRRTLPPPIRRRVVGPRDIARLELDDRGWKGRGGRLTLRGDAEWGLLDELAWRGFGEFADGDYRVVRVTHEIDGGGFRTSLVFLEHGIDVAFWDEGQPDAEAGDA